ncbi:MAG: caspase family protein [Phaeodactylibacter sp.]|nr:caspase family protein [Phaeodactylibacter sp.]
MPPFPEVLDKVDTSRLERFRQRFPEEEYLWLACHAAFFVALTPGLLYRLWVNFKMDEQGKSLDIPLDAVANLLNSPLCQPLGHGVYELHESLWGALRKYLLLHPRFQGRRQHRLARFLLAYLDYCTDELPSPAFAEAQRWTAEAYLNPKVAAQRLLESLSDTVEGKAAASSVEVFLNWVGGRAPGNEDGNAVNPLAAAERLVEGIRHFQKGNQEAARQALEELSKYIKTGGEKGPYRTKVPEEVLALIEKAPETEAEPEEQGVVYALLVAVGKTASGQAQELAGPANDLQLVREQLPILLEGRKYEVNVLADEKATKAAVLEQWRNMAEHARPEDHLLFYFSGHAVNKNKHYLILYDYQEQRMSKVESIRTVTGGVIDDEEFREASAGCQGYITLVLDTHAGGEGWLDLENDKNVILSATLPGQTAYEQRFGERAHGLFSKALLEVLGAGRFRTHKWVVRKAAEWMKASFDMPQHPLVLGTRTARRRTLLRPWEPLNSNMVYLLDLLKANDGLNRDSNHSFLTILQLAWADFARAYSMPGEMDFKKSEDIETAIGHLEKALLFKGQDGLSMTVPGKPDAERELFQLELSLEERLGIPVHVNRKKKGDGDPATR